MSSKVQYTPIVGTDDDSAAGDLENKGSRVSPEFDVGFFSWHNFTFEWMTPLVKQGSVQPLQLEHLFQLSHHDTSAAVSARFQEHWARELKKPKPSLKVAMYYTFGQAWCFAGCFKLVHDIMAFGGPIFLRLLIEYLTVAQDQSTTTLEGIGYALGLFACAQVQSLALHQYFHRVFRVGMHARTSVITAVYRKSLRLSMGAKQSETVGQMVNLMAVDARRLNDLLPYLHNIWSSPFQIVISMVMLWEQIGPAVLAGLAVMLIVMPLNALMARVQQRMQRKLMEARDERVKQFNEVLNGIKIIKMYAWETGFQEKIEKNRAKELQLLRKYRQFRILSEMMWSAVPVLVSLSSFTAYTLLGGQLSPEKAFTSLALFNILRFPMAVLPSVISQCVEAFVSVNRVLKFLNSPEVDQQALLKNSQPASNGKSAIMVPKGVRMFWDDARTVTALNDLDVDLELAAGGLTLVIGKTGCGKSALLQGLCGELNLQGQTPTLNGSISYASQLPWIQNSTVEENILFGLPMDRPRYTETLRTCCLEADLQILPGGDQTEIGEKGINLSGGQKARVALARAVYARPAICLLDDPLSAVDNHVGAALVSNCILGTLADCCVVLATHRYSSMLLSAATQIIMLEDGRVAGVGTHTQLVARGLIYPLDESEDAEDTPRSTATPTSENANAAAAPSTAEQEKAKAASNMTGSEERSTGKISSAVYSTYLTSFGGYGAVALLLCGYVILQLGDVATNRWLAYWSTMEVSAEGTGEDTMTSMEYLGVYSVLSAAYIFWNPVVLTAFMLGGMRAAVVQHRDLLHTVLRAPMEWFDITPVGRVMNRFSGDINIIDEVLPGVLQSFVNCAFQVISVVVVVVYVTPWFVVALVPLYKVYAYTQGYYIRSTRELKRLESLLRSPVLSHFSETLDGLATIRAYRSEDRFIAESDRKLDLSLQAYFPSVSANRWLAMRTEFIGTCTVALSGILVVLSRHSLSPGLGGLSVSYALSISNTFNWMVRMTGERETNTVSVERVKEYSNIEPEAPLVVKVNRPSSTWPSLGMIEIRDLEMRYREGLETVLKGITLTIDAGEKVGIAGRTGAGKSSLVLVLLRIVEPCGGSITIDGVDISRIGLHDLRSRVAIIPQDPVLFVGTLRFNLDPFNAAEEEELWSAVRSANMGHHVTDLDMEVTEGGSNFSVGQRQLICLARALLRQPRVLLMDEATSAVDQETDGLIQDAIKEHFSSCTMLTIAHRLNTILDSDKILVLEQGRVLEFGSPDELRRQEGSSFAAMLNKEAHGSSRGVDEYLG